MKRDPSKILRILDISELLSPRAACISRNIFSLFLSRLWAAAGTERISAAARVIEAVASLNMQVLPSLAKQIEKVAIVRKAHEARDRRAVPATAVDRGHAADQVAGLDRPVL